MTEQTASRAAQRLARTAEIASAYVSRNALPTEQLPNLMAEIHRALAALDGAAQAVEEVAVAAVRPSPAQIRRSVQPEALVSFIDGKSYKTLKRHLAKHGLTPAAYRQRYGLPVDYPTTASEYSERRSRLAREIGLGQPVRMAARLGGESRRAA